ncbi:MAG: CAP domain-containing protein, partial [Leptolyngbyaceae bacterium]|nr:CAP domain-containing protein [Leptolyngbyaceae bacterium]
MMRSLLSGMVLGAVVFSGVPVTNPGKWMAFLSHNLSQQEALQSQRVSPAVIKQASNSMNSLEQAVHSQINQYRIQRRLSPLTLDARISQQARLHSQDMAGKRVPFSHQGFAQRMQAIAAAIPYSAAAENVAYNQGYQDPGMQA